MLKESRIAKSMFEIKRMGGIVRWNRRLERKTIIRYIYGQ